MLGDFNQFINTNFHGEEKDKMLNSFPHQLLQNHPTIQLNNQHPLDIDPYGLCNNATNYMIPNVFPNNCVQLKTPILQNSLYCEENFYCNQNNLANDYKLVIDQQKNSAAAILNQQHQQQNAKQMNLPANVDSLKQQINNLSTNSIPQNVQQKNVLPNHISNQNVNKMINKRLNSFNSNQPTEKKCDLNQMIIQFGTNDSARKIIYENVDISLFNIITQIVMKSNKVDGLESNELIFTSDDEAAIINLLDPKDPIDREILIDSLAIKFKRIYFEKLKQIPVEKRAEMVANMVRNKYKKVREEKESKESPSEEEKMSITAAAKSVQIARPQAYKNFNQKKNHQYENENVPKKLKPVPLEEKICFFCRNNGEPEFLYKTHIVRDPITNRTLCPVLRKYRCEICHATGDDSHTRSYCPLANATAKSNRIDNSQSLNMKLAAANIHQQNDLKSNSQNPSQDQNLINSIIDSYRKEKAQSKIENVAELIDQLDESNDNKENMNYDNKENDNMVIFNVKKKQIIPKINAGNKEN